MRKLTGNGKNTVKRGSQPYTHAIAKPATIIRGEYKWRKGELHLKSRDHHLLMDTQTVSKS